MVNRLKELSLFCSLLALLLTAASPANAQRLERPPGRNLEGTPALPAGTQVVPEGTCLILEMETRLSSKSSLQSDRFRARLASPVVDAVGRTLIPEAAYVEGHVNSVSPAKWRRRSGLIGIDFDYLYMPNGREVAINGYLSSADADDRKRIDEEGNFSGGPPRKRDIIFIGGGAAGGAVIGLVVGGAIAGAGIGAAAGLTATLLMKGEEAVVEDGQRIALCLASSIRLESWNDFLPPLREPTPPATRPSTPTAPVTRPTPKPTPRPATRPSGGTSSATGGAVNLSTIRTERDGDGLLRILITAETPSTGWRIFTNHEIFRDSVEVRLRGTAPSSPASRVVSHPSAPTIVIPDRNGRIQRVIVHANNGSRTVSINATWTEPPSTTSRPVSGNTSVPPRERPASTGTTSGEQISDDVLIETASRVERQIDLIRLNFASTIGIWINNDGSYEPIGGRAPSATERKFLDSLGSLLNSVKALHFNSPTASSRRSSILRISEDMRVVDNSWKGLYLSADLNRQVREMLADVEILIKNG